MYILDYGLMVRSSQNKEVVTPLSSGLPKAASFLERVELLYQGMIFAIIKENSDHLNVIVIRDSITVEKNRIYKENGREATVLSNILYCLEKAKPKGLYSNVYLKRLKTQLRKLLDDDFHYMFAHERTEEEV